MNIKNKISKLVSGLLCFSMIFSNVLPAYAADAVITENILDGEDLSVNERNLEDVTVTYKQASSFFVTIPKTIVLDGWKQSTYAVKVSGDIDAEQCVYVAPVDMIDETENIDFYMKDQASENAKDNVVATVTHNKFHWNSAEVAEGYKQNDNWVSAPDLTAGAWRGIFQMEIKLETHVTHKHSYTETIAKQPTCTEKGEKTYTCDCGDSYTEEIPATGHKDTDSDGICDECGGNDPNHKHSYTEKITKEPTCTEAGEKTYTCKCGDSYTEVLPATGHHYGDDDKCTGCGELNPNHKHSYIETITKEPTCTEKGEKTYTCGCGDSYTEEISAMGHNFVDGTCTNCGKETDSYETAPASAYSNWDYTLDDTNNIITLNYYKGSETDVIVYANYVVSGKTYKTQIASCDVKGPYNASARYMFNAYSVNSNGKIESIKFSKNINTSNITDMEGMFRGCYKLTSLDLSCFDTSNVTNMGYIFYDCSGLTSLDISNWNTSNVTTMACMFSGCKSLTSLDLSSFDTSNVTTMQAMFHDCRSLTGLDLSNFKTSNVTNMSHMFSTSDPDPIALPMSLTSLDLSSFDTSNVTNMGYMFNGCKLLTSLDLSSFDTSNVTNMWGMFRWCSSLTSLDLGSFDTKKVKYMNEMFMRCGNLKTIYAARNKWSTSQASTTDMFKNCGTSTVTYK